MSKDQDLLALYETSTPRSRGGKPCKPTTKLLKVVHGEGAGKDVPVKHGMPSKSQVSGVTEGVQSVPLGMPVCLDTTKVYPQMCDNTLVFRPLIQIMHTYLVHLLCLSKTLPSSQEQAHQ